ncbi:MAG: hypothetical protein JWO69_378 [Thermoleophilia bacterium]|jgi:osmotically-inducible protein OsmY|nr:hypothetical protein [Thermoleophilia bacterium]
MGRLEIPIRRATYDAAFKESVAALRDAEIPFACMGSLALWALGGPTPNLQQDLDFAICEEDAEAARTALHRAGFAIQQPPEDWLFKAWSHEPDGHDSALIDIIFRPAGLRVTRDLLDRCERRNLLAVDVAVLSATDLLVTKLHAITEQSADMGSALQFARSLRERVDWAQLAERASTTPFGVSFLVLVELLGIAPEATLAEQLQSDVRLRDLLHPREVEGPGDGQYRASELARLSEALAQDDRSATLDIHVGTARGRITLRGEASNEHHRQEVEEVVRELAPGVGIDNQLLVRDYSGADSAPERIS